MKSDYYVIYIHYIRTYIYVHVYVFKPTYINVHNIHTYVLTKGVNFTEPVKVMTKK